MPASGFERANLSTYGTTWDITGTTSADVVQASGTTGTEFRGRSGGDTFSGSSYDDTFRGSLGLDTAQDMGTGDDTCLQVEVFDATCEHVTP